MPNKDVDFSKYQQLKNEEIENWQEDWPLTPGFAGADIANCCNEGL